MRCAEPLRKSSYSAMLSTVFFKHKRCNRLLASAHHCQPCTRPAIPSTMQAWPIITVLVIYRVFSIALMGIDAKVMSCIQTSLGATISMCRTNGWKWQEMRFSLSEPSLITSSP